jgi:hypothetical protein
MAQTSESLYRELFELLSSKYRTKTLASSGKVTPVPEEAAALQFRFTKDGEDYGPVTVSIEDGKNFVIYYGKEVTQSPSSNTSGSEYSDNWDTLANQLKSWAMRQGPIRQFERRDESRLAPDMAKREYMNNKEKVAEGYYPMGKKASYSDNVPAVKIILQHNRQLEEGEKRYRSIAKIFVENAEGERFAIPTNKPGLARVYARHIAEGGTPYDEGGKHINSLVEEYTKMAGFVRATRNGQFNESAQSLVNEAVDHYQSLRETLHKMSGRRGYQAYFENWSPTLTEDAEDTTDLSEMFANTALDPRIESVMPILSKLHKKVSESAVDREVNTLAEWADSLISEEEGLTSNNPVGIPEDVAENLDIGQQMANDGITYSPEKENELIGLMSQYMKKAGMSSKAIRYYLNSEDYIPDQLSYLQKQGVAEVSQQTLQSYRKKAVKQKHDALDVADRPDTDDATWVKNMNIASKRKDGIAAANKRLGVDEGLTGAGIGAALGGALGSVVPGLGTAAGAALGGYAGHKIQQQGISDKKEVKEDSVYPNAEVIKSRNGKPVGEIYQDENGWGCLHYKADFGADGMSSREEALEQLKDMHDERKQQRTEGVAEDVEVDEDFGTTAAVLGGAALGAKLGKTAGIYRSAKGDEEAGLAKPRGTLERLKGAWKGTSHPDYGDSDTGGKKYKYDEDVEEGLDANQKRVGQLGPLEKAKNISPVLGSNPKKHPFNGKLVGADESIEESEERPYVCVHAKKGKCEVNASSSYQAAQKAAQKWGLKGTAGIDAHLADVEKDTSSLEESTDELARILQIMNHKR